LIAARPVTARPGTAGPGVTGRAAMGAVVAGAVAADPGEAGPTAAAPVAHRARRGEDAAEGVPRAERELDRVARDPRRVERHVGDPPDRVREATAPAALQVHQGDHDGVQVVVDGEGALPRAGRTLLGGARLLGTLLRRALRMRRPRHDQRGEGEEQRNGETTAAALCRHFMPSGFGSLARSTKPADGVGVAPPPAGVATVRSADGMTTRSRVDVTTRRRRSDAAGQPAVRPGARDTRAA